MGKVLSEQQSASTVEVYMYASGYTCSIYIAALCVPLYAHYTCTCMCTNTQHVQGYLFQSCLQHTRSLWTSQEVVVAVNTCNTGAVLQQTLGR